MNLQEINQWDQKTACERFYQCCSSKNWAWKMAQSRPFETIESLLQLAQEIWKKLSTEDYLEAFEGHPRIGDMNSLKKKYSTREWSAQEQSGVDACSDEILEELAKFNSLYEKRFGFIFIVCATGKSAQEMLDLLKSRIDNEKVDEISNAANEQAKITRIRLEKL